MSELAATGGLLSEVFPGTGIPWPNYLRVAVRALSVRALIETNFDDEHGRAAHYALVPITLARAGASERAALSLNTAVAERARRGGMFVRLASQTIEKARRRGVKALVGVANASSAPGFLGRLGFQLVTPLPATLMIPTPGRRSGILSTLAGEEALAPGAQANGIEPLLAAPAAGQAPSGPCTRCAGASRARARAMPCTGVRICSR
jgi:hypothetical protein